MRVGFIGLGIMGLPMAENISKKFPLIGFDVNKKDTSFRFASSYEEVTNNSDVIITMVPKNEHVISVYNELLPLIDENKICIDMSTISPSVSKDIAKKVKEKGASFLDCPVVKSQPAAIKGELGIYVGGDKDVFLKIKEILECMGKNIIYMGENGNGITMKILHNMLVGEIQNGVNEMFALASKMGLDFDDVTKAISYGGGQCFYLDTKNQNIKNDTYPTAFSVENMNKDVHIAKELMDDNNLVLPGLNNICNIYEKAMEEGLNKEDFSSTYKVVKGE